MDILTDHRTHPYFDQEASNYKLSTLSFSSLPTLKKGSFFGLTSTASPDLGLRPEYPAYFFITKLAKPRISIFPTAIIVSTMLSNMTLMIDSDTFTETFFFSAKTVIKSDLVTSTSM
jgi:hypothetical protein